MKNAVLLFSFLALIAILFGACAKQSASELNAEVERRVEQRLESEHQAAARQQLAGREVALAARERELAEHENTLAAMSATLSQNSPAAGEGDGQGYAEASMPASTTFGQTYAAQNDQFAPDDSDFVGDPYFDQPYFGEPAIAYLTVINQTPRFYFPRRSFRGGRGEMRNLNPGMQNRGAFQSRPQANRPAFARNPASTISHPATGRARVANGLVLQRTR